MSDGSPLHVLLVENDAAHTERIREAFLSQGAGIRVTTAHTLEEAKSNLGDSIPDLAVIDLTLAGRSVLEFVSEGTAGPPYPFLCTTNNADLDARDHAMSAGALDVISKSDATSTAWRRIAKNAISECRHRSERHSAGALREESVDLLAFFNLTHDMVCVASTDGFFKRVNPAFERVLGWSREELLSRPFIDFVHPEDVAVTVREMENLAKGRPTVSFENRYRCADDTYRYLQWAAQPDPASGHIYAVARDVTEQKQAVEELQQSEERNRLMFDAALDAVITIDLDGMITAWNRQAESIFGWPAAEVIGKRLSQTIFPPEQREAHNRDLGIFHKTGDGLLLNRRIELPALRRSGDQFPVELAITALAVKGTVVGFVGFLRDISERKRAQEALTQSEERFRTLVEHAPEAIVVLDTDTLHFVDANDNAVKLFGLEREELLKVGPVEMSPPTQPDGRPSSEGAGEIIDSALAGEAPVTEWVHRNSDGEDIPCELRLVLLPGSDGRLVRGSITDITERKRVDEARKRAEMALRDERRLLARRVEERTADLSAANAELAKTARAKDEFLASMSHELRTPLNAILTLTESLNEGVYGSLSEIQKQRVTTVFESGRHLLALINDILDLSKVEAGKLDMDIGPVDLEEIVRASLSFITEAAKKKGVEVSSSVGGQLEKIETDQRRLKQILVNLLSNAVKFTPEGGKVGLDISGDLERAVVNFEVWDTGIGIAEEQMDRLFIPFAQVDARLSRKYEGTGLGLALVSRMSELLGGGVTLRSEGPGKGSSFTVTLPWSRAAAGAELRVSGQRISKPVGSVRNTPVVKDARTASPLILLAEDNEANIQSISDYLRAKGFHVNVARNGVEAIDRAHEETPSLILMDLQMPGMDGLEATRKIRQDPKLAAVPIIALTALAMPGDRERCLKAGANEYLGKPVELRGLADTIDRLLEGAR